jgi:dTDP-4-dehydrorhamnose reductase
MIPTTEQKKILFTGGSGLLGSEFKKKLPQLDYPSSKEFNICDYLQMDRYLKKKEITLIVHAAAFISPPKIDADPLKALEVNIIGTGNIVSLCAKYHIRLIYISTDYVFDGNKGNYTEDDPVCPINKYAWSKLGGECAVRLYDNALIARTTFGPNIFPYEKAFVDQWTSRESVSVIAKKIIELLDKEIRGVIHVCGERKTVYQYAKSLDKTRDIKSFSIKDVNFNAPKDTSLNCEKYNNLVKKNNEGA